MRQRPQGRRRGMSRLIDGELYTHESFLRSKKDAQFFAQKMRDEGHKVRLIKEGPHYHFYVRRKR